jgi:hypothetical protein
VFVQAHYRATAKATGKPLDAQGRQGGPLAAVHRHLAVRSSHGYRTEAVGRASALGHEGGRRAITARADRNPPRAPQRARHHGGRPAVPRCPRRAALREPLRPRVGSGTGRGTQSGGGGISSGASRSGRATA